ncbi:MAG: DHH family phosphoesterase [Aigarchaeota archaeon]|nr:DHH family phosphoesterase [Aigarchaeota archaeon]MCX8193622.1 DHH family phosphoesterase [Nitrososphaeria archaeon]MDW7987022.1 DHH family phosphoesterase [Nitrososphaerota archaeon]
MSMRDERLISLLVKELQRVSGLRVSILTHAGGDPDSICSAFVLKKILKEIFQVEDVSISVPESPTSHTKALLEYFSIDLAKNLQDIDVYLVVDVGSPEQLGEYCKIVFEEDKKVIVIDHHSDTENRYSPNVKVYSSDSYQSLCELIYDLAEHLELELDLKDAEALLIGIYYDTVRLSIADTETSRKICRLIDKGVNLSNVLSRLELGMDNSERIARLKGAARMKIYRFGDWLIVITNVKRFQSSVARSLILLGAHLALAVGEVEKDWLRASIRASQEFVEQSRINLGVDLAAKIGSSLGGYGGGHSSAAHFECRANLEDLSNRFIEELSQMLNLKPEVVEV